MAGEKTPAPYVNLITVSTHEGGQIVRVVFSDAVQGMDGNERSAVTMTLTNAELFANCLKQVVEQTKKQIKEAFSEVAEPTKQ